MALKPDIVLQIAFDLSEKMTQEEQSIAAEFLALMRRAASARCRFFRVGDQSAMLDELIKSHGTPVALPQAPVALPPAGALRATQRTAKETAERALIEATLIRTRWNVSETARLLGVSAKTMYLKTRKYGLCAPRKECYPDSGAPS